MPDSSRIVFVKNDRQEYNPLYIVDVKQKTILPLKTDTKMNHDVTCSADGTHRVPRTGRPVGPDLYDETEGGGFEIALQFG